MRTANIADHVFGRFQNLNLLVLIADLRSGLATRGDWSSRRTLCPIAHGLSDGDSVKLLHYASQAVDPGSACHIAARQLRVPSSVIETFVDWWDSAWLDRHWLLDQLENLLAERQADADAVQRVLEASDEIGSQGRFGESDLQQSSGGRFAAVSKRVQRVECFGADD